MSSNTNGSFVSPPQRELTLPSPGDNNLWFEERGTDAALVFVHGIFSDSRNCWLRESKLPVFWPDLVARDRRFDSYSLFLGGYYTALDAGPFKVQHCADQLYRALARPESPGVRSVLERKTLVFVCHSTGGIIVRYMLESRSTDFKDKIVGLVLIASPSFGSGWATKLSLLSEFYNAQLARQLEWGNNSLDDLDERFHRLIKERRIPHLLGIEAYENHFIFHRKFVPDRLVVVDKNSAGRYFAPAHLLAQTDHFTCVKPDSERHPAHELLVDFCSELERYQQEHVGGDGGHPQAVGPTGPKNPSNKGPRIFTSKLPNVNPTLIGRENEVAFLDRVWATPATNFVQVIAAGGTGKTALVDKWFRRHIGKVAVFGWSFYSQGTSADRQTSSEPFFVEILSWLRVDVGSSASIYAKAEAIADRLRDERVLLILDGIEPLQDSTGALRDPALKALLQELATANRGLVVCTTRLRIDIYDDAPRVQSLDLDNLTPENGAQYLRLLRVEGSEEDLQQASREYWNHALALTLLGTYLEAFCHGLVHRRLEIPVLMTEDVKQGGHARRVIAAYERMFTGTPECSILLALGYFDRPAEPTALKLTLPAIEDRKYVGALNRLRAARLILTSDPEMPIDCHPLVREYFADQTSHEGHARLYKHYSANALHRPENLEQMMPLFYAVYHGCKAGLHQTVLDQIYRERIRRGPEAYLTKKIGAFGTDLSLLASFFEIPFRQPVQSLAPSDRAWVIGQAGFDLRALGRLSDAVKRMSTAAQAYAKIGPWKEAAIAYGNVSEMHLALGNIQDAIGAAQRAVECADQSEDKFQRVRKRTTLANAYHEAGEIAEASRLFVEAEKLEAEFFPSYPILDSVSGYFYCDLLLDLGQRAEVVRRAAQCLVTAEGSSDLISLGLAHLTLGCAQPLESSETDHTSRAVDFLRSAGALNHLPRGLLARGRARDLDEVFRIATRSGMRLFLADYYIASTRLALTRNASAEARVHFARAEAIVRDIGYRRRDSALEKLRSEMGK
jgi:tetratricopeptide (TPR) repeat protein